MKRRQKYIFLICIAAYLGVMLCITGISAAAIYRSNNNLTAIAENDLRYYLEHGAISPEVARYNANNFVYGPDGGLLAFRASYEAERSFDFGALARRLGPEAAARGGCFRLIFSRDLRFHIAAAIALPLENGGLFLFLRELADANRVLIKLYLAITVLAAFTIVYLLLLLRRSAALEREQQKYIDNVNHELKSPVAAVKALAEPIYDGLVRDPETLRRYSALMLREMRNLEQTISDMLELSRLQNHRVDADRECLPARMAFGDILEKYAVLCDEFGLGFAVEPPGYNPQLYTNGALAARLLEILLSNAFKFTEANGRIRVRFMERPRFVKIVVENDGPAIPEEDRRHIFERYYQGGRAHEKQGSGLGLAIAREIADCLGETLRLERSVSGDTEFSFTVKKQ